MACNGFGNLLSQACVSACDDYLLQDAMQELHTPAEFVLESPCVQLSEAMLLSICLRGPQRRRVLSLAITALSNATS